MTADGERKLWQGLGIIALLLGLAIICFSISVLLNSDDYNNTPSRIEAVGCFLVLCGVSLMALARVLRIMGSRTVRGGIGWFLSSYFALALSVVGAVVEGILWRKAYASGTQSQMFTAEQKVIFVGAACLFLTGLIALIAERAGDRYANTLAERAKTSAGR